MDGGVFPHGVRGAVVDVSDYRWLGVAHWVLSHKNGQTDGGDAAPQEHAVPNARDEGNQLDRPYRVCRSIQARISYYVAPD